MPAQTHRDTTEATNCHLIIGPCGDCGRTTFIRRVADGVFACLTCVQLGDGVAAIDHVALEGSS